MSTASKTNSNAVENKLHNFLMLSDQIDKGSSMPTTRVLSWSKVVGA
jgi:hypothetical protein